ncbi:MAG TPA: hypothetical protein VI322_05635 [Candidatus Saccharimonadia bacterium]
MQPAAERQHLLRHDGYRLGVTGPWIGLNLPTTFRSLADLSIPASLLYNRQRGWGMAIVGWGSIGHGQLGILMVGDEHRQQWLIQQLQDIL